MKHAYATAGAVLARHVRRRPIAIAIPLALALALFQPGAAGAALYKWVDDKGVVHYTDSVPPEAVNKGNVQLSPQGITVKKVDPATASGQRKPSDAAQEQSKESTRQQAESARRDRALLDSYTVETDIDLARSRAIRTIEAALQSAQAYSAQLTKRRLPLAERKAALAGKPIPADLERELAALDAELARQTDTIAQKNKQLVEVNARYAADKERWQALKGGTDGTRPPAAATAPSASAVPAQPPVSRK